MSLRDSLYKALGAGLLPSEPSEELPPEDYETWLGTLFPMHFRAPIAKHHHTFWRWVFGITASTKPSPFIAVWPRGGAKSTCAEVATVALGARGVRRYGLYISGTQEQADDHVGNIGTLLESSTVARYYPGLATRAMTKFGHSRGWRRNRLRTASGFTVDAVGLKTGLRGARLDEHRPDFLILDDIDDLEDTPASVDRKIRTLTRTLLPAGTTTTAVLAVQNVLHGNSIFARLANLTETPADFLADRVVSGPYPALEDFAWGHDDQGRIIITSGRPTWAGQDRAVCQANIRDWGLLAFMTEAQHGTEPEPGGMYDHVVFRHCRPDEVPDLVRIVCWVDPAVTDTDQSDSMGIQVDGIDSQGTIYRLYSWERRTSPRAALRHGIRVAVEHYASEFGVETDQGGDLWRDTYETLWNEMATEGLWPEDRRRPRFREDKAGAGHGSKVHRQQLQLADYDKGRIVHVLGTHVTLERALRRFPTTKPLDLADASYWSWWSLRHRKAKGAV